MRKSIAFLIAFAFVITIAHAQKGLPIDQLAKDGIVIVDDNISISAVGSYKIQEMRTAKDRGKYPDVWVFFVQSPAIYTISVKKADNGRWLYAIGKRKA
jgi:hypothetical protein